VNEAQHDGSTKSDNSMMRFLLRFVGLLCLALGFIILVHDGTKSIADQRWFITKVSDLWITFHEASLAGLRPAVEGVSGVLWDPVLVNFLNAPSWLVLLGFGAVLILVGRKRKPLIGFAR
jgi:hypothetical protein